MLKSDFKGNKQDSKIEKMYFDHLRKMTGEERLKRVFELCRFVWRIAEQSICNEYPGIPEIELKEKLRQRLRQ